MNDGKQIVVDLRRMDFNVIDNDDLLVIKAKKEYQVIAKERVSHVEITNHDDEFYDLVYDEKKKQWVSTALS